MIRKGIAVTGIFIISTAIQLISQIVVTRLFGARLDLDIFLAAVAVPTIVVTVIYGTLNDAFLPLLGEKRVHDEKHADTYFLSTLVLLTFSSFIVATVAGFFMKPLSDLLYAGRDAAFRESVATQMYYMLFSIPLSVSATLLGAYYYARKEFRRFPFAQAIGSVANLLLIVILAPRMGTWALVFAFVANIFFQIVLVIPRQILSFGFQMVNILPVVLAWVPLMIGAFALRSDTLLIRSFGASLPTGYLVYLNLISKIFSLATGVMTIGIQILLLPHLVEYLAHKQYDRAIANVSKAKLIAIGVSVLVTIILALLAPVAIHMLFVGGKFSAKDADVTVSLLPIFILPAIGWGISGVFFQPLLALKKQTHVGLINVIAMILGWASAYAAATYFGPLPAITAGLIVLLFTGIIGSEIVWQHHKRKLLTSTTHQS